MEALEYLDDTIPLHVANHLRQVAIEKATVEIMKADADSLVDRINERYRDIEAGQAYPVNSFR